MLHQFNTVDAICPIERDIYVHARIFILKFDNRYLRMLQGVYGFADPGFQQLVGEFVDHACFFDVWLIN